MQTENMEISFENWGLTHPITDEPLAISSENDSINLRCPNDETINKITLPHEWHTISATMLAYTLIDNFGSRITEDKARSWAMEAKYTHPSYYKTQEKERDSSNIKALMDIVRKTGLTAQSLQKCGAKIATLGCNNCKELDFIELSLKQDNFNYSNVLAVDMSKIALSRAKNKRQSLCTASVSIKDIMKSETKDCYGNKISSEWEQKCSLVLALRSLQSSGIDLAKSLIAISRLLTPGGVLVASIPQITVKPAGGRVRGIFKNQEPVAKESHVFEALNALVSGLRSNSEDFDDITVYYGEKMDVELYVTARRA